MASILSFNTNMMAANAMRNLSGHYAGLASSVRKLSSGLRVSTAADDAAGLAIRELMRADIATINQGVRNANDAISLLQTADGALQIVDEKLIRMKELAEQAATGTYNSDQRLMIDAEYQQMAREMNRIGMSTTFNDIRLLNGNLEATHDGSFMGGRDGPSGSLDNIMFGGELKIHFGTGNDSDEDYYYVQILDTTNMALNLGDEYSIESMATPEFTRPFLLGVERSLKHRIEPEPPLTPEEQAAMDAGYYIITQEEYDHLLEAVRTEAETYMNEAARGFTSPASFQTAFEEVFGAGRVPRTTSLSGPEGLTYAYLEGMDTGDYTAMRTAYTALTGDEKEKYHMAFLRNSINNLREGLSSGAAFTDPAFAGVDPKHYGVIARAGISAANQFQHIHTYAGRNIRTQENAQVALDAIGRAILRKDANRAQIGALQNRLENTVSNLQIQAENLQAAESRISDVDVAEEMTNFVRSQVLTQAAVAMLAQANSVPNMLLSLVN